MKPWSSISPVACNSRAFHTMVPEPVRWPRQENEAPRRELPQSTDEDQFAEGIAS